MIELLEPGPQTTVQDLGRRGQLRYGIPPSGPMDAFAFVLANRLAGNADVAAALECTLAGPRFRVDSPCAIAVTGADMPVAVNGQPAESWSTLLLCAGDMVKIGTARSGLRAYVAFSGGLDVALRLGSRSTYLRGRLGGLEGRALQKGDRLATLPADLPQVRAMPRHRLPAYPAETHVRVVLGPQHDRFTPAGIETFLHSSYTLQPQSDRMGARLRGNRIEHVRGHDIVSDGIALGSVQVPGDGQPIVLLVDRQSTGGYTKLATVCSFDIGRIAQLRPGQCLRFEAIDIAQAHALLREWRTMLAELAL
jgi:antagonist of KipI